MFLTIGIIGASVRTMIDVILSLGFYVRSHECGLHVRDILWHLPADPSLFTKNKERWFNLILSQSNQASSFELVLFFILILFRSLFDLLCELFIIRSTFRLISNIITPFLECETREKAKKYMSRLKKQKAIPANIYQMVFRKGLLNNIPSRYRSFLVPEDENELRKMARIQRAIDILESNPVDSIKSIKCNQAFFQDDEDLDYPHTSSIRRPQAQSKHTGF